jgi:tetratricopeptide (TPR) repeat protein
MRLNILLIALGALLGLLLSEGISRVRYQEPWYNRLLVKDISTLPLDPIVSTNNQGLRDRDYPLQKPPSTRRILILGDSFTFGSGVADGSKIFPELLEIELNTRSPRSNYQKVEILNGGKPSSLTDQWLKLYRTVDATFQPDIVLIVFFLRDGTHVTSIYDFFGPIREYVLTRSKDSWWYRHCYLWRSICDYRDRLKIARDYAQLLNEAYLGNEQQTKEWQAAQRNLQEIIADAKQKQIPTGLVLFPVLVDLEKHHKYPFSDILNVLEKFGQNQNVPVLNLLPAFQGQFAPDLWVTPYDQHPNEQGHKIAAQAILPFVEQLLKTSTGRVVAPNSYDYNRIMTDQDFHVNLGVAYLQAGQEEEARIEFNRALKINPADLFAMNNLGLLDFKAQKYREAITRFRAILQQNPNMSVAKNNLFDTYVQLLKSCPSEEEKKAIRQEISEVLQIQYKE